jgi:hypothetical protein
MSEVNSIVKTTNGPEQHSSAGCRFLLLDSKVNRRWYHVVKALVVAFVIVEAEVRLQAAWQPTLRRQRLRSRAHFDLPQLCRIV